MQNVENRTVEFREGGAFLDRRTHDRFEARNGAFASPKLNVVGQIMNMSCGGLAFRYVASRARAKESSVLRIWLTDNSFNLSMVPFEVAWDVAAPGSFSCGEISMRYCGVRFGDLADYQEHALRYFRRHYRAL
ncbi:MAG: PilZ domain-containing protein [Deltaproteobacteria bacterium]|nr:PilZ domain-containing protein [Deltaproteobacteria bacterium]